MRNEHKIRETGSVALRIQDIPVTHLLTPNAHLVRRNGKTYLWLSASCVFPTATVYFISQPALRAILLVARTAEASTHWQRDRHS